jgi:hypothetical protein
MPELLAPNPSREFPLTRRHDRRLREIYRSAGWPSQDMIEIELLAAGLLERVAAASGHETLRVTDAGVQHLADAFTRNRAVRSAHEALVERVALEMGRAGRVVWRGLRLRVQPQVQVPGEALPQTLPWSMASPDVFSIRNSSVEAYLQPIVHEIKVSRADLLGELRKPAKSAAYRALCGQCWFVLKAGIATVEEIPEDYGVLFAHGEQLELARPAPKRAHRLDFATWMALARSTPQAPPEDEAQARL